MTSRSESESEGEIIESKEEKATTALPSVNGISVDRQSRSRPGSASRSPWASPEGDSERNRSRSPYRHKSPRGEKRRRDDDFYDDRDRSDPRRFRVYYEGRRANGNDRRNRPSYVDLDRSDASQAVFDYDDRDGRDRRWNKTDRARSRSPDPSDRRADRRGQTERGDRYSRKPAQSRRQHDVRDRNHDREQHTKDQPVSARRSLLSESQNLKQFAKVRDQHASQGMPATVERSPSRRQGSPGETAGRQKADGQPEADVRQSEPVDEATLIEERRRRREAIKAKYKGQATPLIIQTLQVSGESSATTPQHDAGDTRAERSVSPMIPPPITPHQNSAPDSPTELTIKDDVELANRVESDRMLDDGDGPSAADYDPTLDMREDQARNDKRQQAPDVSASVYDETEPNKQDVLVPQSLPKEQQQTQRSNADFDMFADDDEDMFAPNDSTEHVTEKETFKAVPIPRAKELDMSLLDNWDDPEGYYRIILGELLEGRYHVQANLGKGMFSGVVRALDNKTDKTVAIKIIRNNETMRKAGMKEIEILQALAQADPEDKKHVIRLDRYFDHKGHLCMVFENMSINLREVLKKFGRDVGINLRAVRSYAQQMFLGLSLLRKCNILHADLKPDNILVNDSRNILKICDLGSAADASDSEITPYLVSRFYRAPEIILGMPYDFAIDTWSIGCTLFELYTGKILFTGRTNNQMLRSIMECRGKFSLKMLKKAEYAAVHFDENLNFRSMEKDKVTGRDVVRMINFIKPTRDLKSRLLSTSKGLADVEMKELNLFADLLDRCLNLNPEKRCTPTEALRHPFINRAKS